MYTPRHFAMPPELLARVLAAPGAGELVTVGPDGPVATHLPYVHRPDSDGLGSLVLHVARNNTQWRHEGRALFLITLASDYVSSLWYPSAQRGGKLVPTWDYATVHLSGELIAHDDPAWTRSAAELLMGRHEATLSMEQMPADYVAGQLRAIVGLELRIDAIEAKAKLSQNRMPEDVLGVIDGLRGAGAEGTADLVAEFALPAAERRAALIADVAGRRGRLE